MTSALESFTPIGRTDTLGRRVREQLRHAIMSGRFSPGEKLTIRAVASALGVSITPAREALYNLASEGSLEMRANGSVYIHSLTEERIVELIKIRIALESLAAREAAHLIDPETIDEIAKLNDLMIEADACDDYAGVVKHNWQMHFTLYRVSAMPQLVRIIEGCWMMTGSYVNIIYPAFSNSSHGVENHCEMVAALRERDGTRLAEAVITDINLVADALLATIGKKQPEP